VVYSTRARLLEVHADDHQTAVTIDAIEPLRVEAVAFASEVNRLSAHRGRRAVWNTAKEERILADQLFWDAGDTGCGELVLELRVRLARMQAGQVLRLVARDPGAPEDIPAWCRMTGHTLVAQQPPVYDIRKES
jgi:tRNA 2-thiouridine synthesizing protein A